MSEPKPGRSQADVNIGVGAIVGRQTGRGLVELTLGRTRLTILPAKARHIATMLLEASSAAEGDEVLVRVLGDAGLDDRVAATVLLAIRQQRAELERRARQEARRALAEDRSDPDRPD